MGKNQKEITQQEINKILFEAITQLNNQVNSIIKTNFKLGKELLNQSKLDGKIIRGISNNQKNLKILIDTIGIWVKQSE